MSPVMGMANQSHKGPLVLSFCWCWHKGLMMVREERNNMFKNIFKSWFNYTSTQGIVQARDNDRTCFKVVWVLAFLLGAVFTWILIIDLFQSMLQFNVVTDINISVPRQGYVEYPSITICNKNRIHCRNLVKHIQSCDKVGMIEKLHFIRQVYSCAFSLHCRCGQSHPLIWYSGSLPENRR